MGRVKEAYSQQHETEQRIVHERVEAAYFAVPEALQENLDISRDLMLGHGDLRDQNAILRTQLRELQSAIDLQISAEAKWKERAIGFILGCLASIVASAIWLQLSKTWSLFR